MKIIYAFAFLPVLLLSACGNSEKEITGPAPVVQNDPGDVVMEEKGQDPAGFPCGLKNHQEHFTARYRGADATIDIRYDCPDVKPLPDDPAEKALENTTDQENRITFRIRAKNFDTTFLLLKKPFVDSLGADFLRESVFGGMDFRGIEQENWLFTIFIGRAYSDDGLEVDFTLNRKKGITITRSAYADMGENEQ